MASPADTAAAAPPQNVAQTSHADTSTERPSRTGDISPTQSDRDRELEETIRQFQQGIIAQPLDSPISRPHGTTTVVQPATQSQSTQLDQTPTLTRKETEALGPATEDAVAHPAGSSGPQLSISLMLITGARHPYKIDEKYLKNRKVEARDAAGAFDPQAISGYQLKELIWTDWRTEWEPRPPTPSSIRLIILGRMIEDKSLLRDLPFKSDSTNVVHMTVKPADLIDDDDNAGKGTGKGGPTRVRDTEDRGAGCRCVIQ